MRTGAFACISLFFAAAVFAQSDANKGSINGTVFDPRQAVVAGARVSVSNPETGLMREGVSNGAGQYRFVALDPGTYQVKAEAPGFAVATVNEVVVTVGGAVQVDVNVALQPSIMTIDVSSALVQVTESNPSQTLNQRAIRDLPINGRRFQDFATLTPTVQANDITRGQLSFVGQRGINSNVMIDGTDYNEPFFGGIRGGERSIFAFTVPQSSVMEFQAVISGYAAEYGRSTGGVLNAVTRSGNNTYHGDGFYQIRHKELGLKNPLNQQSLETQHQFGGGAGGPVKRDRMFFFGAAERQQATFPRLVRFATLDSVAGNVTPDIAPAYNYFRSLERPFSQTNDATAVLGRVDYQFGTGSRLTGRYNYSNNNALNAASTGTSLNPQTNSALSNNGNEKDNTHTAVGQFTTVIGANLVNDLRVQYSREGRPREANATAPSVSAGVIGTFGTRSFLPTTASDYRLQFADAFTVQHGRHTVKLGADYNYVGASQIFGFNQFGTFTISGSNVRTILQILSRSGADGNRFDDASVTYNRQIGNLSLDTSIQQLAFFTQDSWRVANRLTLNYGLRWEGQFNPAPAANNDFLVTSVRDFVFPLGRVDPTAIHSQFGQWMPRLGLAWNLRGTARTVLRAESGIYYAQTPLIIYSGALNNFRVPPGDLSLALTPSGTNTVYRQLLGAGIDLNKSGIDQLPVLTADQVRAVAGPGRNPYFNSDVVTTSGDGYRNPRSFQAAGGIEHDLAHGLLVGYQLNHVNTVHLERNVDYNVPRPFVRAGDASQRPFFGLRSTVQRPDPNVRTVLVKNSGARSNFTGNSFRVEYRHHRWQASAHYTLSYNKSDDDNERTASGVFYQNPFDFSREYNWSSLDARHQFGAYTLYEAPLGIELSGLFRYRGGLPFDPTTGADTSELLSGSAGNRPLEAPGVTMLRNSFRNRGLKTVDARFIKNFRIREGMKFQFSCEMFNLFNWANMAYTGPAFTYGLGLGTDGKPAAVDPRFMRLRDDKGQYDASTTLQQGTPFQAQMGFRLIF